MKIRVALTLGVFLAATLVYAQRPGDELFLSPNDIPRVLRITPRLAEATNKGLDETHTYLVSQELSYAQLRQVLTNVAVAYTAIKLEEYLKQVEPLLEDANKASQYRSYVTDARKQLADLTAKYDKVRKNGHSALDVNKEYVRKNQAAVEEVMVHMRNLKLESLPKE